MKLNNNLVWKKNGFTIQLARKEDAEKYADDILMAMLEDDWKKI